MIIFNEHVSYINLKCCNPSWPLLLAKKLLKQTISSVTTKAALTIQVPKFDGSRHIVSITFGMQWQQQQQKQQQYQRPQWEQHQRQ